MILAMEVSYSFSRVLYFIFKGASIAIDNDLIDLIIYCLQRRFKDYFSIDKMKEKEWLNYLKINQITSQSSVYLKK